MQHAITGRWSGKRSNGRACTVTEATEYDRPSITTRPELAWYILVDHEPTERLAKGRYRILPSLEEITCDDPDAP